VFKYLVVRALWPSDFDFAENGEYGSRMPNFNQKYIIKGDFSVCEPFW
jgi:hypothetical protein